MKIWVDDIRPAPEGYVWCQTVNEVKHVITNVISLYHIQRTENLPSIELLDLDHDAGELARWGGDYIKILDWLEKMGWGYRIPIRLHTMNPVGRENMRRIIQKNGWTEVM
jgi:hypothetical protein